MEKSMSLVVVAVCSGWEDFTPWMVELITIGWKEGSFQQNQEGWSTWCIMKMLQEQSRQVIVDAAAEHEMFAGKGEAVIFTGGEEVDGKKYNSQKIRNMLCWEPNHQSFADFMKTG